MKRSAKLTKAFAYGAIAVFVCGAALAGLPVDPRPQYDDKADAEQEPPSLEDRIPDAIKDRLVDEIMKRLAKVPALAPGGGDEAVARQIIRDTLDGAVWRILKDAAIPSQLAGPDVDEILPRDSSASRTSPHTSPPSAAGGGLRFSLGNSGHLGKSEPSAPSSVEPPTAPGEHRNQVVLETPDVGYVQIGSLRVKLNPEATSAAPGASTPTGSPTPSPPPASTSSPSLAPASAPSSNDSRSSSRGTRETGAAGVRDANADGGAGHIGGTPHDVSQVEKMVGTVAGR